MRDEGEAPTSAITAREHDIVDSALQDVWQVANKLSQIQPRKHDNYRVTIFGSARIRPGQELYEDVKALAAKCAQKRCDIITGGGPGLMQAANEGAQIGDPDDKIQSIGIRIDLPFEQGANAFVEDGYTHQTFFTRLHHFIRLSNAFIVVGGGVGTTLETFMVWQLLQVRHVNDVPLILVGPMWRGLVDWAKQYMVDHNPPLASASDLSIPVCVDTVEEALALLEPRIAQFHDKTPAPSSDS
jgi:uncharacterized protein (TIGR00730 family)